MSPIVCACRIPIIIPIIRDCLSMRQIDNISIHKRKQSPMPAALNSFEARDIASHAHPQTNLRLHEEVGPLVIERGDGVFVVDKNGNRFLEGMAGLWCASLGFSERRLADAA